MIAPWLAPAWARLAQSLATGRVHHGLLFAAPSGYGKRALADAFCAAALCLARGTDGQACGGCRSCLLVAAGTHPDRVRIGLETRDDGKLRSEITVDQMRALGQRLALSSQFGGWQVALVDPADALNANAANALLKTLEEPASSTILLLVADDASRLPATIRSRCQRVGIALPSRAQSLEWLASHRLAPGEAAAALDAGLGNPGAALAWHADGTLALRSDCASDLAALAGGAGASGIAERWMQDRPVERLWFAAALARDEARRLARGEPGALGLTARDEIPKLAAWFGHANRSRGLLATTVRGELVLLDLLRAWPRRGTVSGRA